MCTSYKVGDVEAIDAFSQFPLPLFDFKPEIYKDYAVPILRRGADGFSTNAATFGMAPRKSIPLGVKVFDTMNVCAKAMGPILWAALDLIDTLPERGQGRE